MRFLRAKLFLVLTIIIITVSCAENDTSNLNSSTINNNPASSTPVNIVPKDDIEELGKTVKLSFAPEEAVYYEFDLADKNTEPRIPAPTDKKLVAVLKFSEKDAAQIVADAQKYALSAPADVDSETWFPPELIAKSQETGDSSLKGVGYAANDFFQTPYLKGKITRINETNYFVLELLSF